MAGRGGISPGKVLLFGLAGLLVGEAIKLWQDDLSPFVVSALTVVAGAIPLLVDYAKQQPERAAEPQQGPRPYPGYPPPGYPPYPGQTQQPGRRRQRPQRSLGVVSLVVGLVLLLVVGGGLAYGVSWGVGWLTGREAVIADRLVAPVTGTADTLSVTVTEVGTTSHYTKVTVTAVNRSNVPVTMPLFGFCQLVDASGSTLKPASNFGGGSPIEVPANGVPVGQVITFSGHPPDIATTMTLDFSGLFPGGPGFRANSLQVRGIRLVAQS